MTDVKICWMMRNNLTLLNIIDHLINNRSQGDDNSHVDEDWREYGRLFVKNPRGVRLRSRRVIDTSEYETFNSIWINDGKVESVVCWRLILRSSVDYWLDCYVRNNIISDVSAVVLLSKVAQIEYNSQKIGRDIIDVHASSSLGN